MTESLLLIGTVILLCILSRFQYSQPPVSLLETESGSKDPTFSMPAILFAALLSGTHFSVAWLLVNHFYASFKEFSAEKARYSSSKKIPFSIKQKNHFCLLAFLPTLLDGNS